MAAPTTTPADFAAAYVMEPTTAVQWLAVTPMALCIAFGALLMMIRHRTAWHPTVALTGLGLLVLNNALLLSRVTTDGPLTMMMGRWLPPFGIAITVDITGALLALAAAIVAFCGALYARVEITTSGRRYGFYPLLMLLMAGVCGAFLTGDIFNLYVWFEVLLISSFGLLILGSEREQIDGALKYAVLNLMATTLFLITVGYLYAIFGTLNMADIALKVPQYAGSAPLMTLSALFVLAFSMKAAAFPVNFWLPPPITRRGWWSRPCLPSAHQGRRLCPPARDGDAFPAEREALSLVIAIVAALTMILGAMGALAQNDIRRVLGFVVIAGIGNMMAGIAIGSNLAVGAAIFYALHSILLMTALYLVAGEIARIGGHFRLDRVAGLWVAAPLFGAVSLMLFFAASGLPPFSGFWPKALLVKASIDIGAWWLAASVLLSGFLTTIAFGRVFLFAFWRPVPEGSGDSPISPPPPLSDNLWRIAPIVILTGFVVWFGLFPDRLIVASQDAATGLLDPTGYIRSVFPEGDAR